MRKKPARAIDAVAFHQIVQDAPVRLNSLRFGMICQAAVISTINNPKFKGSARVSLMTLRVGCEEQAITRVTMKLFRNCAPSDSPSCRYRRSWAQR
jgi:hypothetical protein